MPQARTAMRKVKEVLRLRYDLGLSYSQIRRSCGVSNGTLNGLLTRAETAGLTRWEQVRDLTEEALEKKLFQRADDGQWLERRPLPDWAEVDRDLRRHKHLTLKLVWGEYIQANPTGYGFSQFCGYFRRWPACCTDGWDGVGREAYLPFGCRLHAAQSECCPPPPYSAAETARDELVRV
jgi:hypothetical protein